MSMYEFIGWAVVEDDGGSDAATHALLEQLREEVAKLDDPTRWQFHVPEQILNGYCTVHCAGLRNHGHGDAIRIFEWLAARSRRSYGLLYERHGWDPEYAFHVWKLHDGQLTRHADPFQLS